MNVCYTDKVNTQYAFEIALKVSQVGDSPQGFRNTGGRAAYQLAEMLVEEMRAIGLKDVAKEAFPVDAWEYKGVTLKVKEKDDKDIIMALGPYSSATFSGSLETNILYLGKGTKADYADVNAEGKIILVDIDMIKDWWITWPALEAELHGAKAIICAHTGAYAQKDDTTLNAFSNSGATTIPAFSIGRGNSKKIQELLKAGLVKVSLEGENLITPNGEGYNVLGKIPGKNPNEYIIVGDHYDGHFFAFLDNASAVGATLAIAKGLIESSYHPERTLVFVLHDAEEYGSQNSKTDWCAGAWNSIFKLHPDWQGKTLAYLNFEVPFRKKANSIKTSPVLASYLNRFMKTIETKDDGFSINYPLMTVSDDWSYDIAGIPAMIPDLLDLDGYYGNMVYHSQYDLPDLYDENGTEWNLKTFGQLIIDMDQLSVLPLDFSVQMDDIAGTVNAEAYRIAGVDVKSLTDSIEAVKRVAQSKYNDLSAFEQAYRDLVSIQNQSKIVNPALFEEIRTTSQTANAEMLKAFRTAEDGFLRLDWRESPIYPNQLPQNDILSLQAAIEKLKDGNVDDALWTDLVSIQDSRLSFYFSRKVIDRMNDIVEKNDEAGLRWGFGRRVGPHLILYDTIQSLSAKSIASDKNYISEIAILEKASETQKALLGIVTGEMITVLTNLKRQISCVDVSEMLVKAQAALKNEVEA